MELSIAPQHMWCTHPAAAPYLKFSLAALLGRNSPGISELLLSACRDGDSDASDKIHLVSFLLDLFFSDRKHSKDLTPFSGMDLSMQTLSSRIPSGPRSSTSNAFPPNRDFQKGSSTRQPSLDNSISMHEAVALFPSLQRLSMKGERLSLSTPYNSVSGLPALQKKLKSMLGKAQEDGKYRPLRSLPEVKPEEILSCRLVKIQEPQRGTQRVCPIHCVSVCVHR